MKYSELTEYFFARRDVKYAEFTQPLSNSTYEYIGIRLPDLQKFTKEHKCDTELNPDDFILGKYFEIDYIYFCLSIARLQTVDEQFDFLREKSKYALSWCITDSFSTFMKPSPYEKYMKYFLDTCNSEYTYTRRSAYVLGLKHYRDKEILDTLKFINKDEEYMVMMSQAWLMATVAICFPDEIFDYLSKTDDVVLKRKTISKICDSRRIDPVKKEKFKTLRT